MNASWSEPFILETLDTSWDTYPASAGVYLIMSDQPIPRIGGTDDKKLFIPCPVNSIPIALFKHLW